MMCDCIEQINEQLVNQNTVLNVTMSLSNKPVRARIETMKLSGKVRVGPVSMTATYCPFCGVKYQEATE